MRKYLIVFLVFIAIVAGIILFFLKNIPAAEIQSTWMIYAYFCLLTLLFHIGIVRSTKERPQVFVRYYMASTTLKLLLHLGIIVIFAMLHREQAMRFIITFMIMYFLFTLFEVVYVVRK